MARLFAFLALALVAASVVADEQQSVYSDEQLAKLDERIFGCTEDVPQLGDFDLPGLTCAMQSFVSVASAGVTKEEAGTLLVKCIESRFSDNPSVVDSVRSCITKAMSLDV